MKKSTPPPVPRYTATPVIPQQQLPQKATRSRSWLYAAIASGCAFILLGTFVLSLLIPAAVGSMGTPTAQNDEFSTVENTEEAVSAQTAPMGLTPGSTTTALNLNDPRYVYYVIAKRHAPVYHSSYPGSGVAGYVSPSAGKILVIDNNPRTRMTGVKTTQGKKWMKFSDINMYRAKNARYWGSSKNNSSYSRSATPPARNSLEREMIQYFNNSGCSSYRTKVTFISGSRSWTNMSWNAERTTVKFGTRIADTRGKKYIAAHECSHVKQIEAFDYDLNEAKSRIGAAFGNYGGVPALERAADCMVIARGVRLGYTPYVTSCTSRQLSYARMLNARQRI